MSVVATEVFQYIIMTISSIAIAVIAFNAVSHAEIMQGVPRGWDELFFGWKMDLDWSGILPQLNEKIAARYRNQFLGFIFQSFNLINFKSALDNVALPLYYKGVPRKERLEKNKSDMEKLLGGINTKLMSDLALLQESAYFSVNLFPTSYYNPLQGGTYEDALQLIDAELPDNKEGRRVNYTQQKLHEEMIQSQYDN